ncbi:hypothetical protein NP233_g8038 [Leucocoprinus birnbaumii]|uniref:Uncharacterized protein n=1 Tax=Leucocoprinus birnbaumii TaxID=56174 RepID=A0AAD5VN23_9AGAR|nr:hypothetical protein NP233_g8038 [Leucocoprinus birnbaumii]
MLTDSFQSSPVTNLPSEILIAICTINAQLSLWESFVQDFDAFDIKRQRDHIRDTINASHTLHSKIPQKSCPAWNTSIYADVSSASGGVPHFLAVGEGLSSLILEKISLTEQEMVVVLRELPRLRYLVLNRVFRARNSSIPPLQSNTPLHLGVEEFRLVDDYASRATKFLNHVTFSMALSIFSLELCFKSIESMQNPVLESPLVQQLASILSAMSLCGPLLSLEISCRRGVTFSPSPIAYSLYIPDEMGATRGYPFLTPCFHAQFTPCRGEGWDSRSPEFHTYDTAPGDWKTFINSFHSALGNLGAYARVHSLAISSYTDETENVLLRQALNHVQEVVVLNEVSLPLWDFLCNTNSLSESLDSGCIFPNLAELRFAQLDITLVHDSDDDEVISSESSRSDMNSGDSDGEVEDELTGAAWLSQPLDFEWCAAEEAEGSLDGPPTYHMVDRDGNILAERDEVPFIYEPGKSDYGDEIDTFHVEDLEEFCRQHPKLQVVVFPDLDEALLEELRTILQPLGVRVTNS